MSSEKTFDEDIDYRQVLVLRKDLRMRAGKLAAQAAHAAMARLTKAPGLRIQVSESGQRELVIPMSSDLEAWVTGRFKKICVYVPGEAELLELFERVKAAGLDAHLVQDAGLTEFAGVPTHTFVSIGPHPKAILDPFTGHLPLY